MELGSSASDETEVSPNTEPGLGNEEELFTEEWVIAEVMQTLAELWDRGDETLVQALAAAFLQRGGQVPEDAGPYNLHYQLARELRPYLQRQPLHCDIPAQAWQDWYDGMTNAIQVVATRIRRARWQRRANNENHGSHALPPNCNDRRTNADALDADTVAMVQGTTKRHGGQRVPEPRGPPSATHRRDRDDPSRGVHDRNTAPTLPKTRWLQHPPPWRRHSMGLRRRIRGRKQHEPGPARTDPYPTSCTNIVADDDYAKNTRSNDNGTDMDIHTDDDEEIVPVLSALPFQAAADWRRLLQFPEPSSSSDAGDPQQGGLLPSQRRLLIDRLLPMTATDRAQLLTSLHFFFGTIVMDVATLVDGLNNAPQEAVAHDPRDAATHEGVARSVAHAEEDDLDDDHALMQRTPPRSARPRTASSPPGSPTFDLLRQALQSSLQNLTPIEMEAVNLGVTSNLRDYDPDLLQVQMLLAMFRPSSTSAPSTGLTPPRAQQWMGKWWDILHRHLSNCLQEVPPLLLAGTVEENASIDNEIQDPAPSGLRDAATQTSQHHGDSLVEVLFTVGTSLQQESSRVVTVRLPVGEAVALTVVAAVRPVTGPANTTEMLASAQPFTYQHHSYAERFQEPQPACGLGGHAAPLRRGQPLPDHPGQQGVRGPHAPPSVRARHDDERSGLRHDRSRSPPEPPSGVGP